MKQKHEWDRRDKLKALVVLALAWAGVAYVLDVLVRPKAVAKEAREKATKTGKPMLNVGAGTPESSLRAKVFGPQLVGDVNLDIAAPRGVRPGPDKVSYGDVQRLPYPDKHFGVAFTSHVIEHVDDPRKALSELDRVADDVVNVTPSWWAPHTWLYKDHQWYVTKDQKEFVPLWKKPTYSNGRQRKLGKFPSFMGLPRSRQPSP
jgi:ubiquinone/menaquinone biosynthesis C-methylase UbiE